jgi:hypothetical protein
LNALPSQGSCSGTEPVTCNLGTLANGATATIMLTGSVESTFVGPVTNTAQVESAAEDPDTTNNQTELATAVVSATMTLSPASSSSSGGGGGGCTIKRDAQIDPLWLFIMIGSVVGVVFQQVIKH